ncbi:hypothetical protein [Haloechinothrix sp. LS1_15]|uniref:hypothetical protein n=1 Tax=Haloechinothrix sp. LS1_15 TaxID=2652248 RepID=UPI0029454C52|nr:hypothetical protein [Haloechinothrix sp. LS1_15]MDV6014583.1 hypothetical protein [Haloechinothrix sp. LS1_15]
MNQMTEQAARARWLETQEEVSRLETARRYAVTRRRLRAARFWDGVARWAADRAEAARAEPARTP